MTLIRYWPRAKRIDRGGRTGREEDPGQGRREEGPSRGKGRTNTKSTTSTSVTTMIVGGIDDQRSNTYSFYLSESDYYPLFYLVKYEKLVLAD